MYPLFESICIKNGILQNFEWHQYRFETSYLKYYHRLPSFRLGSQVEIPDDCRRGTYKLRILYNDFQQKYELERYNLKEINQLKVVEANELNYDLKYTDRSSLINLLQMKGDSDDILIVKNGLITDTSFCNIVFFDGREWLTPQKPLLAGTARARLLDENRIKASDLSLDDLKKFKNFKLVNAMRDFDWVGQSGVGNIII